MSGRIFQLNVSQGGVPKRAVAEAKLEDLGLEGDRVANARLHGGPARALCLYPLERILALQEEGCTVFPGALGENVTLVGIDWTRVTPGARLALGDALVEITSYTEPCRTTSPFVGGSVKRYHQDHHPGWSRVYSSVLRGGRLAPAMPARLIETS